MPCVLRFFFSANDLATLVAEMDPHLSKKLEKKVHQKRAAKPMGGRSTRIRIGSPPVLPFSGSEGLEPPHSDDFRVVRVQSGSSTALASDGNRRSQTDRVPEEAILGLSEEIILSLSAPQVIDSSSKIGRAHV